MACASWLAIGLGVGLATPALPAAGAEPAQTVDARQADKPREDRSGKKRKGEASYYCREFTGKRMADGERLDPESDAAASKTLPLGTKARVKNLDTGASAEVEILDRGLHVPGRIIDVTPRTAEQLDMKEQGVAPVEVTPLELPPKKNAD